MGAICSSGGNTDQHDLSLLNYQEEARCFYAICIVINPARSRTKIKLYSNFKKQMEKFGVRLITVECTSQNSPFTVTQPNYEPYNIQVRSESFFFQKENLINLAVSKLPQDSKYVCWVDYEVEFTNPNWLNDSIKALNMFKVAQLFDEVSFLNQNGEELKREKGYAVQLGNKKNLDKKAFESITNISGFAWGIRKDALKELGGWIDYLLIGNAEKVIAYCLAGKVEECIPDNLSENLRESIKNWQKKSLQIFTQGVGFIPGNIKLAWNGQRKERKVYDRWDILTSNNFDPRNDLRRDENGLFVIELGRQKFSEELKVYYNSVNGETQDGQ